MADKGGGMSGTGLLRHLSFTMNGGLPQSVATDGGHAMTDNSEGRLSGALIIGAVVGSLVLMLHHPTSFKGPDDGLLLHDWSNTVVHGAMMVCLFLFRFGLSTWARKLGLDHPTVRAGKMAFEGGMTAFIGASLFSGFAASGLAGQADPDAVRLQLTAFGALNRALANLGMVLTVVAMALWAVRMIRLTTLTRIAAALGLVIAVATFGWLILAEGAFGLYPATVATVLFGAWSSLVAAAMTGGDQTEGSQ